MPTLEYEPARKQEVKVWPFWLGFAFAYLPGLLILDIVDDLFHMRMTGHHNDGGVMFLSVFISPVVAGAAALIKTIRNRYNSVSFAVSFAVLAPLFLYLLWCAVSLLFAW